MAGGASKRGWQVIQGELKLQPDSQTEHTRDPTRVEHWRKRCLFRSRQPVASLIGLLAFVTVSDSALAQSDTTLFGDEIPVVLSASRLVQNISSAPASITVIDAELIELSGARNIVDILRLVPGFQVGRLVNGNPVAAYYGNSERYNPRLQLLIDGRPTYVPLYGGTPWGELPIALTDIERVEVTRAPNAATFGPNSFTSVVSITTRAPATRDGWLINSELGGNQFGSSTVSYHGSGEQSHFRLSLQAETDEGFESVPDRERSSLVSFRSHWQITPIDRLGVDIGGVRGGHMEVDTVVEENDLASYSEATNTYTQLVWERSLSSDDSLRIQYYYNYFDITDDNLTSFNLADVTGNPALNEFTIDAPINRDSRSIRHELELQRLHRLNKRHRIAFGGALREDSVKSRYIFNDNRKHHVSTQRLFAHSEFDLTSDWIINSGILIENNSISNVSASPRVSATRRLANGHWLRFGFSRGVRTPLLLEENGNIVFTYPISDGSERTDVIVADGTRLDPEIIDVTEISYQLNDQDRGLELDFKLAHHNSKNLIGTERESDIAGDNFNQEARVYDNRHEFEYSSFEVQFSKRFSSQSRFRLAYAHPFDEDTERSTRRLIPSHTLSVFGSHRFGSSITLSGEYYYTSQWIWDDVRDESRLSRLDLRLSKGFDFLGTEAILALQAELDVGETNDYLDRNDVSNEYFARFSMNIP